MSSGFLIEFVNSTQDILTSIGGVASDPNQWGEGVGPNKIRVSGKMAPGQNSPAYHLEMKSSQGACIFTISVGFESGQTISFTLDAQEANKNNGLGRVEVVDQSGKYAAFQVIVLGDQIHSNPNGWTGMTIFLTTNQVWNGNIVN